MKTIDDYLPQEKVDALNALHIEYAKVHWIGWEYKTTTNPLIDLVMSTKPTLSKRAHGATAWYNVRPIDPKWHNDIDSYCSYNRKSYYPNELPKNTFIYYMKSSDKGGSLEIETGDLIRPKINRLVRFPCWYAHRVQPYEGNRVSIGIIWWYDLPSIYCELNEYDTVALDRVWEKEDAKPYK